MRAMKIDIRYPISTGHLTLEAISYNTHKCKKKVFHCRPCVQYWSATGATVASLLQV